MDTNAARCIWGIAGNWLDENQNLNIRVYSCLFVVETTTGAKVGGSLPLPFGLKCHRRECLAGVAQNRG